MSDNWRPGLSQNIEEDEEIEDDHLVPPTPGQEDIDAASPSQDNASALSCLTSPSSSKRTLMFMGDPLSTLDFHTADDELMPYLSDAVRCQGDELESGFEKALSNAAAASVGVNTTQWGTPPTSPTTGSSAAVAITSAASLTTDTEQGNTCITQAKSSILSSKEFDLGDAERKENTEEGSNNLLQSQGPALSLSDEEEDIIPPSPPSRELLGTPKSHTPFFGGTSSAKRKHDTQGPGLYNCSPCKQPKIDDTSSNATSDSAEEKVIVDYGKLIKKDVEISPKRKEATPTKPLFQSSIAKRINFSSEDSSDSKNNKDPPSRLPYDTELEDSDCEIIEDKNKSIEVLFEKPKKPPKIASSFDISDSQELNLQLTGLTQNEDSQMSIDVEGLSQSQEYGAQRLSQATAAGTLPYGLTQESDHFLSQSQSQSQSLLQNPLDSVSASTCPDSQTQGIGSMRMSQIEDICGEAVFTQPPDIGTLLSGPINKKNTGLSSKSNYTVDKNSATSNGKGLKSTKEVILSQSQGYQTSKTVDETPRSLKLPDISTPSSQELTNTLETFESESVFEKVSKAVERKILTNKNNEHSKLGFENSSEQACDLKDQYGSSNNSSLNENNSVPSPAVTSPIAISQSSHSTPISSQAADHKISNTSKLFNTTGKKDLSLSDKSQQVLVEESDTDEEGPMNRSKNKKAKSKLKEKPKDEQLEKIRKSSTPNTSHGISPHISDESYIQKNDISSEPENSKSSPQNTSVETTSGEISRADTQLLTDISHQSAEDELVSMGFKPSTVTSVIIKKFIREHDKYTVFVFEDEGREIVVSEHSEVEKPTDTESGRATSGSSNGRRISDISYKSSSSGYFADKSSSSDASRRFSMHSTKSGRQSMDSIMTISPTRGDEYQDDHHFAAPQGRARKGKNTSPIMEEITFKNNPKKSPKGKSHNAEGSDDLTIVIDDRDKISPGISVHGTGRSGRESGTKSNRVKATRGRPKGKGRGKFSKVKDNQNYDSSTDSQNNGYLPKTPKRRMSPSKKKSKDVGKYSKTLKKGSTSLSPCNDIDTTEELENILSRCYSEMPLSEEEESAFMLEGGQDDEIQLHIIQNKVRHTNLEKNMLVFARFTDNVYYSARLLKEDSNDRWLVEYTLDRYSHSVRDVHILPTILLPRGQHCAVRPDNDTGGQGLNDTGVVRGHLWEGKDLKHIIAADRGKTLQVSHSHLVLTGDQIKRLLEARLKYRSMVASPGSDVNFDNICPGKRRRAPLIPYASPGSSRKEDPNLDSTSDAATAGESEDLMATPRKSPSKARGGTGRGQRNKRKNLLTVTEESESDEEVTLGSSTPRGRGRGRPPSSPRTPKSSHKYKSTPEIIAKNISDSPLPNRILEIQHEELPMSPSPKKRGRSQSETKKMKMDDYENLPVPLDSSQGPLPQKKDIFSGFIVLITDGKSSLKQQEMVEDFSDLPALNKDHLREQVRHGGGRVVDSFSEVEILLAEASKSLQSKNNMTPTKSRRTVRQKEKASNKILLIANTFCRTAKYISCLAAGIPCVDFRWIIDCCSQNKYLDWINYILLAGKTDNGEFEQKINMEIPIPSKVLSGTCVFLASSTNSSFKNLWHPILVIAHAEVRDKPKKANQLNGVLDRSVSVILADSSISSAELSRAHQLKIPIVSTTWLIESIITVKRQDYDHSVKYAHDYTSSLPQNPQDQ